MTYVLIFLVGNYKIKKWKCVKWGNNRVPQKCGICLVVTTYRQTTGWALGGLTVSFVIELEIQGKRMYVCGNCEDVIFGHDEGLCLLEGKRPLGRPRRRREDSIEMGC